MNEKGKKLFKQYSEDFGNQVVQNNIEIMISHFDNRVMENSRCHYCCCVYNYCAGKMVNVPAYTLVKDKELNMLVLVIRGTGMELGFEQNDEMEVILSDLQVFPKKLPLDG